MWINAMSKVARRKGVTVSELLKQRQNNNPKQTYKLKKIEKRQIKKDPFEGMSSRDLYNWRPMD